MQTHGVTVLKIWTSGTSVCSNARQSMRLVVLCDAMVLPFQLSFKNGTLDPLEILRFSRNDGFGGMMLDVGQERGD